jgi:hypothetical protein
VETGAAEVGAAPDRHQADPVRACLLRGEVHGVGGGPQAERGAGVDVHGGAGVAQDRGLGGGVAAAGVEQRQVEAAQVGETVGAEAVEVAVHQRGRGRVGSCRWDAAVAEHAGGERHQVRVGYADSGVRKGQ